MQRLHMFDTSTLPIRTKEEGIERFPSGTAVWRGAGKESFVTETSRVGWFGISQGKVMQYGDGTLVLYVERIRSAVNTDRKTNYGNGIWPINEVVPMTPKEKKKYKVK